MSTITVNIKISKAQVLEEVAKTTAYIGSKSISAEDPGAYSRVSTTTANQEQLDRYWMSACTEASHAMRGWMSKVNKHLLNGVADMSRDYEVTLRMPTNWHSVLVDPLKEALMSHLVNSVVGQWLMVTKKEEAQAYAILAAASLQQVKEILLTRRRPDRRPHGTVEDDNLWHRVVNWSRSLIWK